MWKAIREEHVLQNRKVLRSENLYEASEELAMGAMGPGHSMAV